MEYSGVQWRSETFSEVQWSTVAYTGVQWNTAGVRWSTVEYSGVLELLVFGYFKHSLSGLMGLLLILPLLVHSWLWPNRLSSVLCFCGAACESLCIGRQGGDGYVNSYL